MGRLVFWLVTFGGVAVRPTSGARALRTCCAAAIAGLVGTLCEAKRVRDMREYPFWARGVECIEILRFIAPRKILRDSPTRRDTPILFIK